MSGFGIDLNPNLTPLPLISFSAWDLCHPLLDFEVHYLDQHHIRLVIITSISIKGKEQKLGGGGGGVILLVQSDKQPWRGSRQGSIVVWPPVAAAYPR